MSKLIEVKGVQYTESRLERALAIEEFFLSQKFRDMVIGEDTESIMSSVGDS